MRDKHLSDEELVLAAGDGHGRRISHIRSHLEGCAQCQSRATEFERLIAQFAQAERRQSEMPPIMGPRTRLRARIAEITDRESAAASHVWIPSIFFARTLGVAALAIAVVVTGVLTFRYFEVRQAHSLSASSGLALLPNREITPGATRQASLQQICALPHEEVIKEVSPSERQMVLAEYGIPNARSNEYEVDYLITPGLGGDDSVRNLWPEPYNAAPWNAHAKDALEERLHEMVCAHQLDLKVAQKAIATNWIEAYQKYLAPKQSKAGDAPRSPQLAITVLFTDDAEVAGLLRRP